MKGADRLALGLGTLLIVANANANADASDIAFVHAQVVPMNHERVLSDQTVIVRDDRIVDIGPAAELEVSAGATRIDATGLFLTPAFADMHVHLRNNWPLSQLDMYLAYGVTTIRDLGGQDFVLQWRDEIKFGKRSGPTIYVAAPIIYGYEQNQQFDFFV